MLERGALPRHGTLGPGPELTFQARARASPRALGPGTRPRPSLESQFPPRTQSFRASAPKYLNYLNYLNYFNYFNYLNYLTCLKTHLSFELESLSAELETKRFKLRTQKLLKVFQL